jgi:hypothetical protein
MSATERDLQERLKGALDELGRQAPPFVPSVGEMAHGPHPSGIARHARLTRALAAAAAVAAVSGVAVAGWMATSGPSRGGDVGVDPGAVTPRSSAPAAGVTASRRAVDRIARRATALELETGYGRVSVDYAEGTVTVFWKGQPPRALEELATESNDVVVTIRDAVYSEADITAAARRLIEATPSEVGGAQVATVAPNADLSGAIVQVLRPWNGDESGLRGVAGLPISVVLVDEAPNPVVR